MSKNIEGYGYGVWLLVEDDELKLSMDHPVHITIMCNMNKEDAFRLYGNLIEICGKHHITICNNICERFEDTGYSKDEPFKCCSGYYCEVEKWHIISYYCKKRLKYDPTLGSFSSRPHITYSYSNDFEKTNYLNLKHMKYLKCKLVMADIRHPNPFKWSYV